MYDCIQCSIGPFLEDLTLLKEQAYNEVSRSSLDVMIKLWSSAMKALPDSPFNIQQLPTETLDAGYSYFVDSGHFAFKFDISAGTIPNRQRLLVAKYSFE